MQLLSVFTLLLAGIITIITAANSDEYIVMSKFKSGIQASHAYAFKSGPWLRH
jgi:anaerobic C4-dicarboxylate transporter